MLVHVHLPSLCRSGSHCLSHDDEECGDDDNDNDNDNDNDDDDDDIMRTITMTMMTVMMMMNMMIRMLLFAMIAAPQSSTEPLVRSEVSRLYPHIL